MIRGGEKGTHSELELVIVDSGRLLITCDKGRRAGGGGGGGGDLIRP